MKLAIGKWRMILLAALFVLGLCGGASAATTSFSYNVTPYHEPSEIWKTNWPYEATLVISNARCGDNPQSLREDTDGIYLDPPNGDIGGQTVTSGCGDGGGSMTYGFSLEFDQHVRLWSYEVGYVSQVADASFSLTQDTKSSVGNPLDGTGVFFFNTPFDVTPDTPVNLVATFDSVTGDNPLVQIKVITMKVMPDFGDLPTAYNLTREEDNGARHTAKASGVFHWDGVDPDMYDPGTVPIYLGATVDEEANGTESANADGDDTVGRALDDEDGVSVVGTWAEGADGGSISVTVTGGPGYLSGWIDWDENNDFTDSGDHVLDMVPLNAGTHTVTFDIPAGALPEPGDETRYARFRLDDENDTPLETTGLATNGEVEDYLLAFSRRQTPTVNLSVDATGVSEGTGIPITVTATASSNVSGIQTVDLGVSGTGVNEWDYTLSRTTIIIPDGGKTGTATFDIVDDTEIEGDEIARLTLSNPSEGIALGAMPWRNVTLRDNDLLAVASVVRAGPSPTSAASVDFIATFYADVTGVDSSDFRLNATGVTGASITSVSGGGNCSPSCTVTVDTGAGDGTIRLDVTDNDTIRTVLNNQPLGGAGLGNGNFSAGQTYEIAPEASIRVSAESIVVSEPNGAETFTLSLSRSPAAPVTVRLYSLNQNECALTHVDGVALSDDPVVVLDATNWFDGVAITVAAKADYRPDGDSVTRILIAPASSLDDFFDNLDPPDPEVTVTDVYDGIAITDVYPTSGIVGTPLPVTVDGVGFGPSPTVKIYQDNSPSISVPAPSVNGDGTRIDMTLPAVQGEGAYNLLICNGADCANRTGAVTFLDTAAAEAMKRKKAIIVAGGDPGDALWPATDHCAEKAYAALLDQGYTHDTILYLSAGSVAGDVDEAATLESLEHALLYWAKALDDPGRADDVPQEFPADELLVYMTGHGDPEVFRINEAVVPAEQLSATVLAGWFQQLQYQAPTMPGKLIFVYDACNAGSFLWPLRNSGSKDRYVVASVPDGTKAWFADGGEFSFSWHFWNQVSLTGRLYHSFVPARDIMALGQSQHALIDIDGDGAADDIDLNTVGPDVLIGRGRIAASDTPEYGTVMADVVLDCEKSQAVWVAGLVDTPGIEEAWGLLVEEVDETTDASVPIVHDDRIDLFDLDGDDTYEGEVSGLTRNGVYSLNFYFRDKNGIMGSVPGQAVIDRQCSASVSDAIYILKTLVGLPQPALDAQTFDRIDADGDGKLGLVDALETLRLVGEL